MTHLPLIGFILILLGFTGLLLTGAIDWTQVMIDPRLSWILMSGGLMVIGIVGLIWRKR